MKRILFVCKHNRFRSRTAEAAFNKLNPNKEITAESAGLFQGNYPLSPIQVEEARKLGLNIEGKPRGISDELLKKISTVIIVADNVPPSIFNEQVKEILTWNIPDVTNESPEDNNLTIRKIIERTEEFIKNGK